MKILVSAESKSFQSRSKRKIPSPATVKRMAKRAFLIDSDARLFMYLIQCTGLGSVWCLNQAFNWVWQLTVSP